MNPLERLPNIGKTLTMHLERVGIHTPEQLRAVGAREAFLQIRAQVDPGACFHMLTALAGASAGVRKQDLPPEEKDALLCFFRTLDKH